MNEDNKKLEVSESAPQKEQDNNEIKTQESFQLDKIDSIPSHIKRYIEHLCLKKKTAQSSSSPEILNNPAPQKSFFDVVAEIGRQHGLQKVQALCKQQTDQYLGNLYTNSIQTVENPSKKVLNQTQNSSQLLSNSIQEVPHSDIESDNGKDLIEIVTEAANKIVTHLNELIGPTIDLSENFNERQKQYKNFYNSRLQKKQKEIDHQKYKNCTHTPKINRRSTLICSYYQKQAKNVNGHLLKTQHKSIQTEGKSSLVKNNNQKKFNVEKSEKQKFKYFESKDSDGEKVKSRGVQTDFNSENGVDSSKMEKEKKQKEYDLYIPIQNRVQYILEAKKQKIEEQVGIFELQREQEFQEQYVFYPNQQDKSLQTTRRQASNFFDQQVSWKCRKEQDILQRKVSVKVEEYTYRPKISQKSREIQSKKLAQSSIVTYKMESPSKQSQNYNSQKSMDIIRRILFDDQNHQKKQFNYYQ